MKKICCLILSCLLLCVSFTACSKKDENLEKVNLVSEKTDYVAIQVEDYGTIVIHLRADVAPITVANFQKLVSEGFYDGLIFHRVIENFMIQGGDPKGNGTGGSSETIKGEFESNGVQNDLSHKRGVISMARNSISMDSASSQFFICHADSTYLDGDYAAFGEVIYGLEVVDAIASVQTNSNDKPLENVTISSIQFATLKKEG
ncbi:MAG: peptidylprolyl isomerase [Clostridia bacterium]|nr:peptidylprolyl isomerase [Clostridia bacterium]